MDDFMTRPQCEEFYSECEEATEPYSFGYIPRQIGFWDNGRGVYVGGIGFEDKIICGCCGAIVDPMEIIASTPSGVDPFIVWDEWEDISNTIMEGEFNG